MLEGEAGIGKTTLWRSAVVAADSYFVLSAQPVAAEAELSHASLRSPRAVRADVLPGLPRPQRRALEGALLLAEPEADPQPRAVAAGFLSVLRELAREQPVLVALDDVHWLDTSSRAVLDFAFRRLRNEAVAVLISARADAEERSLAHGPAFEGERITRVQLGGLDASAVQTLLRERLGLALTRPTLLQVVGASGGNPFFALELGRALHGRTFAPGEPLEVPASLKARREGSRCLPAGTLDVLGVAALAGDCGIDMLARALDADPSELLRPAIDADVIEVTATTRVRFTHPLLASVSHAGTNDTSRRNAPAPGGGCRRPGAARAAPRPRRRRPRPDIAEDLDQAARDASRRALRLPPQSSPDSLRSSRRLTDWTNAPIASSPPRSTTGSPASTATRALLEPLVDMLPASPRRARALFCLGWTGDRPWP